MTPATLAALRPGQSIVGRGLRYRVTTAPRQDEKGNPYCYATSGSLVARISVSDCGYFELYTPYRIYVDGREFGIDYPSLDVARTVKRQYQKEFPGLRYYIRKVPA